MEDFEDERVIRTEFEQAVFRLFHTADGQYLLSELSKRHVYVDIVQADGEVPSAIREGKSQLIRFLEKTYKSQLGD